MPRKAYGARHATPVDVHVGKKVREKRASLDMSQSELARACSITFQQIQKYENGTNRVSASRLWQFAAVLDMPIGYFFDGLSGHKLSAETIQTIDSDRRGNIQRHDQIDVELIKLARAIAKVADPGMKSKLKAMISALSK